MLNHSSVCWTAFQNSQALTAWSFLSCQLHVRVDYCAYLYESSTEINRKYLLWKSYMTPNHWLFSCNRKNSVLFHLYHSNLPMVKFQPPIFLFWDQTKTKKQLVIVKIRETRKRKFLCPGDFPFSENLSDVGDSFHKH